MGPGTTTLSSHTSLTCRLGSQAVAASHGHNFTYNGMSSESDANHQHKKEGSHQDCGRVKLPKLPSHMAAIARNTGMRKNNLKGMEGPEPIVAVIINAT